MYVKEEREAILRELHRSGMSVGEACRRLPLFPTRTNLYRWLRMEEAGELAAAERPDRAERMHCAHGEGIPRYAEARARAAARGAGHVGARCGRAGMAEVKLAEAPTVLDVLKAPGPGSLSGTEKHGAGEAARRARPRPSAASTGVRRAGGSRNTPTPASCAECSATSRRPRGRPGTGRWSPHTDGVALHMGPRRREACERPRVVRPMSRRARSPDNARAEGLFGTLKRGLLGARDWTGPGSRSSAVGSTSTSSGTGARS